MNNYLYQIILEVNDDGTLDERKEKNLSSDGTLQEDKYAQLLMKFLKSETQHLIKNLEREPRDNSRMCVEQDDEYHY